MSPLLPLAGLTLLGVWFGPLAQLSHRSFAAHMTVHMTVVAIVAPALAWGLVQSGLDPVPRAPRLFSPVIASIFEFIAVWAFHAPALHHGARHVTMLRVLEQGSFLLAGLWLWLSVLGGSLDMRDVRRGTGIVALLLTSMHMTLLGALLALPQRLLYESHGRSVLGLDALGDQQLGGAIMLLVGGVSYLIGGMCLSHALLRGALSRGSVRP